MKRLQSPYLSSAFWFLAAGLVLIGLFLADQYIPLLAANRSTDLLPDFLWTAYGAAAIGIGITAILRIRIDWMRYCLYATAIVCVVSLAYIKMGQPGFGIDDANIFMVYARNLRHGYGFVYNPNGERVEGFSSMLWVLMMSGMYFISVTPEMLFFLVNMGFMFCSIYLVIRFLSSQVKRSQEKLILGAGFLLVICSNPEYLSWMTFTLMDTGLWSFLLVASTLVVLGIQSPNDEGPRRRLSLLLAALALTRPESMAWGMAFLALAGFRILTLRGGKVAIRWIALPLAVFLGTVASLTLFRLAYFGFPFPNTYYAKVSPSFFYNLYMGFYYYFVEFARAKVLYAVGILVVFWWFGAGLIRLIRDRGARWRGSSSSGSINCFFLACIILVGLIIPILYGGDHFYSFRQYQPIFPLLLGLILLAGIPVLRRLRVLTGGYTRAGILWLAVPLMLFLYTDAVTWKNVDQPGKSIKVEFDVAWKSRNTGEILSRIFTDFSQLPSIGVVAAGGIKLTYPGEVIDLMGLNNVRMGHNSGKREGWKNHAAFNIDVFFELAPEIVLMTCSMDDPSAHLQNIQLEERFQQQYTCVLLQEKKGNGSISVAIRRDYLEEIQSNIDSTSLQITASEE